VLFSFSNPGKLIVIKNEILLNVELLKLVLLEQSKSVVKYWKLSFFWALACGSLNLLTYRFIHCKNIF